MTNTRFKTGEKIKIKEDLTVGGVYCMSQGNDCEKFSNRMRNYMGKEATIVKAEPRGYKIDIDIFHWYTDSMIENIKNYEDILAEHDAQLAESIINHMLKKIPEQLINHALDTEDKELFQEVTQKFLKEKE